MGSISAEHAPADAEGDAQVHRRAAQHRELGRLAEADQDRHRRQQRRPAQVHEDAARGRVRDRASALGSEIAQAGRAGLALTLEQARRVAHRVRLAGAVARDHVDPARREAERGVHAGGQQAEVAPIGGRRRVDQLVEQARELLGIDRRAVPRDRHVVGVAVDADRLGSREDGGAHHLEHPHDRIGELVVAQLADGARRVDAQPPGGDEHAGGARASIAHASPESCASEASSQPSSVASSRLP